MNLFNKKWEPPNTEFVKLKVDAFILANDRGSGPIVVSQDNKGPVFGAMTQSSKCVPSVHSGMCGHKGRSVFCFTTWTSYCVDRG